jgi:outer membrane protein assembly factor BamB
MRFQKPFDRFFKHHHNKRQLNPVGNVLIYVVVLMLIFGVLGVVMVSLFTSTTASTVTRNDSRRARYMAESGMRYAFSEIRKAFSEINGIDSIRDFMNDTLNITTYKIGGTENFTINVFSPWFVTPAKQDILGGGGDLVLEIPVGELPEGYSIPASNIYAINYRYKDSPNDESGSWAPVTGFDGTTNILTLSDDFHASISKTKEEICLAVQPKSIQPIVDGGNLNVSLEAQTIFPKYGGAINIRRNDYFYEERIDDSDNNRVILRNLSKRPESDWITANTTDFVILSPRNYMVAPTGTSDGTVYRGDYTFAKGIYYSSLIPESGEIGLTTLSEQETDTRLFELDTVEDILYIGGEGGGGLTNEFGTALFDATLSIGGDQDYCVQGACLFELGVRVYFLLDFNQQGDGITFTLINAATNNETSAGGDIDLSELMGYGGDSRTQSDGSTFLATAPEDRGLDPPKIAVEFDTRTNNRIDDPPPDYCVGLNVETNLRNDPLTANKDAVQYVFWGRENFLDIPCRGNSPLYDDNRHDADGEQPKEEWRFGGASAQYSVWRPAIGPDGTIYASALDSNLYALNKDGSVKWTYSLGVPPGGNNDYMPGVDPDTGTIYSDVFGDKLVAINPDGSFKWDFYMDSDVDSTPVVGPDGTIYFGTDGTAFALFALNPNGTEKWNFPTGWEVDNVPALNSDASVVYFVATDPDTLNNNAILYAVNTADGSFRWQFPLLAENNELTSSPTVDTKGTADPNDDVIYVGDDDWYVYALKPAARLLDPTPAAPFPLGAGEWRFRTNGEIESSAAVDPNDGTVYIGSDDGNVWAINPNGTEKWRFPTGAQVESTPIIDVDRTIYIGSTDGNVYAINPDGTQKWFFPTGGGVPSSPALGQDGFIHIGSDDSNFYTISQFGDPRNFKDEDKTAGKLLTVEDLGPSVVVDNTTNWLNGSSIKGPWAVRLEINRNTLPGGEGDYELRLWMKQCDNDACDTLNGSNDPFFRDTRIIYRLSQPNLVQFFQLDSIKNAEFDRFLFGFTAAAGADPLAVTIANFVLSYVRPGDPVIN